MTNEDPAAESADNAEPDPSEERKQRGLFFRMMGFFKRARDAETGADEAESDATPQTDAPAPGPAADAAAGDDAERPETERPENDEPPAVTFEAREPADKPARSVAPLGRSDTEKVIAQYDSMLGAGSPEADEDDARLAELRAAETRIAGSPETREATSDEPASAATDLDATDPDAIDPDARDPDARDPDSRAAEPPTEVAARSAAAEERTRASEPEAETGAADPDAPDDEPEDRALNDEEADIAATVEAAEQTHGPDAVKADPRPTATISVSLGAATPSTAEPEAPPVAAEANADAETPAETAEPEPITPAAGSVTIADAPAPGAASSITEAIRGTGSATESIQARNAAARERAEADEKPAVAAEGDKGDKGDKSATILGATRDDADDTASAAAEPEHHPDIMANLEDLPTSYGSNTIRLAMVDPERLLLLWDLSPALTRGSGLISLRFHLHTPVGSVVIDDAVGLARSGNYYLNSEPDGLYDVELGLTDSEGRFRPLMRSNPVRTPTLRPRFAARTVWRVREPLPKPARRARERRVEAEPAPGPAAVWRDPEPTPPPAFEPAAATPAWTPPQAPPRVSVLDAIRHPAPPPAPRTPAPAVQADFAPPRPSWIWRPAPEPGLPPARVATARPAPQPIRARAARRAEPAPFDDGWVLESERGFDAPDELILRREGPDGEWEEIWIGDPAGAMDDEFFELIESWMPGPGDGEVFDLEMWQDEELGLPSVRWIGASEFALEMPRRGRPGLGASERVPAGASGRMRRRLPSSGMLLRRRLPSSPLALRRRPSSPLRAWRRRRAPSS